MTTVELQEELHSNTRRTRITYRGLVNGQPAAIKCYRKPLLGIYHVLRAMIRGRRIRRKGAPLPDIVYSGWVSSEACFGYATEFLSGFQSMRHQLLASSEDGQALLVRLLGKVVADLHQRGIEQTDGNLTNFLINGLSRVAIVDEDDIRVYRGEVSTDKSIVNLANIAARLPENILRNELLNAYLEATSIKNRSAWRDQLFWEKTSELRAYFDSKRSSRKIAARKFD